MSSPTASYAHGLNAQKLSKIEVLVTLATPAVYESGVSIYWRTAGQHPRYVTLEKYDSTFTESLGKCCDNYDMQNEVVTSIYCGTVSTQNGTNFKFTFTGFPSNSYWSLAFTQIAFTGLIGGIEGTVVMRKGGSYSSMFGDFYPYKNLGANLGTSSFRWYNVYSGYGNFSNTLTANGGITVPNGKTITINGKAVLTEHQDISGKANASDVVTALGTNGNNITWTRNGTVNNLTVPYATKAGGVNISTTDNAIARYDGTTGNLQNSGVTINDSNQVSAAKFITSGGTSSSFVKGDGSLDNTTYAPQGSTYSKTEVDSKLANGVYIGNTVGTV